jgi:hypothetical protein
MPRFQFGHAPLQILDVLAHLIQMLEDAPILRGRLRLSRRLEDEGASCRPGAEDAFPDEFVECAAQCAGRHLVEVREFPLWGQAGADLSTARLDLRAQIVGDLYVDRPWVVEVRNRHTDKVRPF